MEELRTRLSWRLSSDPGWIDSQNDTSATKQSLATMDAKDCNQS
jgi:hypothetical protein